MVPSLLKKHNEKERYQPTFPSFSKLNMVSNKHSHFLLVQSSPLSGVPEYPVKQSQSVIDVLPESEWPELAGQAVQESA